MPQRRALTIELAAQRWWCLLRYCRFLCDRPVTVTAAKITRLQNYTSVGMQPRLFTALRPKLTQAGPRDDRVQSWPHPRVGLDSQRLKGSGPAGCGSDELTDPALLHFDQCARKRPPIEKGSGQVICNSPGHGLVGDADGVGDGSSCGTWIGCRGVSLGVARDQENRR